jgi:hypothetical protein
MKYAVACLLVLSVSSANAQAPPKEYGRQDQFRRDPIGEQFRASDVYFTRRAADELRRRMGESFTINASQNGFSKELAAAFGRGLSEGTIYALRNGEVDLYTPDLPTGLLSRLPRNPPYGIPVDATNLGPHLDGRQKPPVDYLLSYAASNFGSYIRRFPTIKISVTPAPPRDYSVMINGENCPATEKSEYKVMPGASTVRVMRPARPVCEWSGTLDEGAIQLVTCGL